MTPWQLARMKSEHAEQRAFFAWANCASHHGFRVAKSELGYSEEGRAKLLINDLEAHPQLCFMFAIPNGGKRDAITAGKLKAEGVKPGVPDVMLPIVAQNSAGLFIEFKREARKNHVSAVADAQNDYHNHLRHNFYNVVICYRWQAAANCVMGYLGDTFNLFED